MNPRRIIQPILDRHANAAWDMKDPKSQAEFAAVLADMTFSVAADMDFPLVHFAKNIHSGMPYEWWRDRTIEDIARFFASFVSMGADPEIICRALFNRFQQAVVN